MVILTTNIEVFSESRMASDAAKKFWGCPELMENLLPFLDTFSIICLAKAHKIVQDIVLGKTVWNKLIRQVLCANRRMPRGGCQQEDARRMFHHPDDFDLEKEFTQMKIQVLNIHLLLPTVTKYTYYEGILNTFLNFVRYRILWRF